MADSTPIQRSPEDLQEIAGVYAWHRLPEELRPPLPADTEARREMFRAGAPADSDEWFAGQVIRGHLSNVEVQDIYRGLDLWQGMAASQQPTWNTADPEAPDTTADREESRRQYLATGQPSMEGTLRGLQVGAQAVWPAIRDTVKAWATMPRENDPISPDIGSNTTRPNSPAQNARIIGRGISSAAAPIATAVGEYREPFLESALADAQNHPAFLEGYYEELIRNEESDQPPAPQGNALGDLQDAVMYDRWRSFFPGSAPNTWAAAVTPTPSGIHDTILGLHPRTGDRWHRRLGTATGRNQAANAWRDGTPEVAELYGQASDTSAPAPARAAAMQQIEALWNERNPQENPVGATTTLGKTNE